MLRKKLRQYLQNPTHKIVRIARKNIIFGKWLQHGLQWPDHQVRLFYKKSITWPKDIHTQPIFHEEIIDFPALEQCAIVHFRTPNLQIRIRKIEEQALQEHFYHQQKNLKTKTIYKRIFGEFHWRYFEHEGYQDGMHGFVVAKLWEYYRFIAFLKYWEDQGYPELIKASVLKEWTDTEKKLELLENEIKLLKDSKLYKVYGRIKKIYLWIGLKL